MDAQRRFATSPMPAQSVEPGIDEERRREAGRFGHGCVLAPMATLPTEVPVMPRATQRDVSMPTAAGAA
jgi:hypothetical protein